MIQENRIKPSKSCVMRRIVHHAHQYRPKTRAEEDHEAKSALPGPRVAHLTAMEESKAMTDLRMSPLWGCTNGLWNA